jgi:hypothetical protein
LTTPLKRHSAILLFIVTMVVVRPTQPLIRAIVFALSGIPPLFPSPGHHGLPLAPRLPQRGPCDTHLPLLLALHMIMLLLQHWWAGGGGGVG